MGRPQPYEYTPLEQDNDTVRMLTLDPGQPGDLLAGRLDVVPIDSAGSYEALSYVWGEPGPPNIAFEIMLRDGGEGYNEVTQGLLVLHGGSLFAALNRLRLPDQPRRVWADQCCINQADLAERSSQVRFMNRIYRDAAHVLVWLGLDTKNEAKSAFGLIRELDVFLGSHPVDGLGSDTSDLERHVRENHQTIQALTDLRWFKRGWVVQEIGTSTPATMIWGDASIEWDTLANVCERLKGHHRLRSELNIKTSDISFLHKQFIEPDERTHHANRFNLVYELQRSRHLSFTDDKDRVFAFLGHFSVRSPHPLACGPVDIVANYDQSVEQTYIDVAATILRTHPDAACVLLASVLHRRNSLPSLPKQASGLSTSLAEKWLRQNTQTLPSWVPDWRVYYGSIILAEPICPHFAHGDSAAKLDVIKDGNKGYGEHQVITLRIHGMEIDTIEECSSRPLDSTEFYAKKNQTEPASPDLQQPSTTAMIIVEQLWHDICKKREAFNLRERYLESAAGQENDDSAFFALMQTLSNGCVQSAGHECKLYSDFPERVWLQKAARYVVETMGTSSPGSVADEVVRLAEEEDEGIGREKDDGKWSRWAMSASHGRKFARTTRKGYYVLGPAELEAGDVVCVLFGCKVPFCLRPLDNGGAGAGGEGRYLLVGECYVHGLMKGEAVGMLARGELEEKAFDIL